MFHSPIASPSQPMTRYRSRGDLLDRAGLSRCLPGPELDAVAEMAQQLLGSDISAFSVLDQDWQWLTAKCGIGADKAPREYSFCGRVVDANEPVIIPDTQADPFYRDNPMVTGEPHIGAYCGVPVITRGEDGTDLTVGSLCVIYRQPRLFSDDDIVALQKLANIAAALVGSRLAALELVELATERTDDLHRVARMHRQLHQAERIAGIGSWRFDLVHNTIEWSDQVYAIHDLPLGDTPQIERAMEFYPGRSRAILSDAINLAIEQGRPFDEEIDFVSAFGAAKRVRSMGEVELCDGRPVALIGVFQDVTRRYEMEQALRRSAHTDELTGLTNRAGFNQALSASIAGAHTNGTPLALLMIDLDGFKAVNDRCGHLRGDQVLRTIATALHAPYLADCVTARLGGDEFGVIVRAVDRNAVSALVIRLLADLHHSVDIGDAEQLCVSGTIGVSWLTAGMTERDLLRQADIALYHGKHTKRGTATTYSALIDR